MEPEKENSKRFMGEIVRQAADYANYPNAIGFSFRFFVREILGGGGVKLLAVDGVAPSLDAVRDGTYPLTGDFYAVTRGNDPEPNPNTARLLEWILSPQGQSLVEKTGYAPIRGNP